MIGRAFVVAAAAALIHTSAPPAAHAQHVTSDTLANGLRIVVVRTSAPALEVTTEFFVGGRDERKGRRGLAHLLEHLAMRESRDVGSIAATLQRLGVSGGASTDTVSTGFYETATTGTDSVLHALLSIARVRMAGLALLDNSIDVEKRRIRIESGSDALDDISRNDLETFHARYYTPANAIITITSSLDSGRVFAIAREVLGAIPARGSVRRPASSDTAALTSARKTTSTDGWRSPRWQTSGWMTTSSGLSWSAATGGDPDSVFLALSILPDAARYARKDVAALEILARTWPALRIGTTSLADSLAALYANISVTSLPYPPLATTDPFRMIGTPLTAIGETGVQISGSSPRHAAHAVADVILAAIRNARTDTAAVDRELARQRRLLEEASRFPNAHAEIEYRRSLPVPAPTGVPHVVWQPATIEEQRTTMAVLVHSDVEAALRGLSTARIRVALLGVDSVNASSWLGNPVSGGQRAEAAPATVASCITGSPVARPKIITERGTLFFGVCLPLGNGPTSHAAAAIANALIGGREDAILADRLRGATGLVYDFESRMIPVVGTGTILWYLRVGTRAADVQAVVAEVRATLARIADDPAVVRRIDEFREWLAQQRQNQAHDAARWVGSLLVNGKPLELIADDIRNVSNAEVLRVLRMLRDAPLTIAPVAGPR